MSDHLIYTAQPFGEEHDTVEQMEHALDTAARDGYRLTHVVAVPDNDVWPKLVFVMVRDADQ